VDLRQSLDEIFLLGGRLNQPGRYGLDNIRRVLSSLGNPERKVPYFHITGTKGKGSTARYIHSMLIAGGLKTGLYISPSLFSTLERISINKRLIAPCEFVELWEYLKPFYSELQEEEKPSTFETFTIMAFLYFLKEGVDVGVLETGLGGRLDATNVIEKPVVSVITDVSFDHQKYLGNTLREIAFEKAKIIKENAPVVVGVRAGNALQVIVDEAKANDAPYYILGRDFGFLNVSYRNGGIQFDFFSLNPKRIIKNICLESFAIYHIIDASLAIQSIIVSDYPISEEAMRYGLKDAFWPGRFEILKKHPLVILDGAHNDASSRALRESIEHFLHKKVVLLFSMLSDKNVYEFLLNISSVVSKIVITTVPNAYSRTMSPYEILRIVKMFVKEEDIILEENPRIAYSKAKSILSEDDVLLVTGSLYLVGFVRALEGVFTFFENKYNVKDGKYA